MTLARATRRPALLALSATLLVFPLLAACGDDDDDVATDTSVSTEPATTTTATGATTTTGSGATTTTAPTPSTAEGDLPGEPVEFGPAAGAQLGVVGVAHDDTLNVRAAPGTDQEVLAELDPLADDLVATGRNRSLPESIWYEVEAGGTTGWVSSSFVAYLGDTTDVTADVEAALGELPRAETMVDLADAVVATRAALDEEPIPRVTVTVAPTVGDLGEITVDVVGYPDDATLGERLHVFGTPAEGGEGFVLRTVESQVLCRRGVSGGLCV